MNRTFEEKYISRLFDLQRFQQNVRLRAVIDDVESRYAAPLSDEDLTYVNAAGEALPTVPSDKGSDDTEEGSL